MIERLARCCLAIATGNLLLVGVWAAEFPDVNEKILRIGLLTDLSSGPIQWINGTTAPGAVDWLKAELTAFEAARPGVAVEPFEVMLEPGADPRNDHPRHYEKVVSLGKNVVVFDTFFSDLATLLESDLLVPIDDFLPDPEFDKRDFYDNLWDAATFGGQVWGVPWAGDPLFLVCNLKKFKEAGIAAPPETWGEMVDCVQKLSAVMPEGSPGTAVPFAPVMGIGSMAVAQMSALLQQGAGPWTESGFTLKYEELERSLDIWRKVEVGSGRKILKITGEANLNGLRPTGMSRVDIQGSGMLLAMAANLNLIPNSPDYRLAHLPTDGAPAHFSCGRLYFAVRKSTPEEEKASWELIKWLTRADAAMPKAWGGYPCRKDFVERADFKARAQSGIQNLEVLYESIGRSKKPGPLLAVTDRELMQALGNSLGLREFNFHDNPTGPLTTANFATAGEAVRAMIKPVNAGAPGTGDFGLFTSPGR